MIGIYGGTFDPFHLGHRTMAIEVCDRLALEHLYVVPVANPPHRESPQASAEHRLEMARLGLGQHERISIDDRELRRSGVSYTVDTLISFREQLGSAHLCLILGADAFTGLPSWNRWQRVLDLSHIVVLKRPSADLRLPPLLRQATAERFVSFDRLTKGQPHGLIATLALSQIPISSTSIRTALNNGVSVDAMDIPEAVKAFIKARGLYDAGQGPQG